jgi:tRNA(Ile)-lysidine synthase
MRLRRIEPVLRAALRGPCALPAGSRLLVAVSGGADSTALLVALASLSREHALELTAAHLHHGLRGADADADLAHVRELCAWLGVPLRVARWNTRERMRREGLAGEAGLRVLRRRFLRAAAASASARHIATAHTADDQLETVLMRLARGTSLAGLGGMRPRHGRWIKPLLGATRLEIERDLAAARIAWREDASNRERDVTRNRIRLDVVPALVRALSPAAALTPARAALARRAASAAADVRAAAAIVVRRARTLFERGGGAASGEHESAAIAVADAAAVAPPVLAAALRLAWRRAHPGAPGLTRRHVESLARLIGARTGARVALPGGWEGVRERERIVLARAADGRLAGIPSRERAAVPGSRRPVRAASNPTRMRDRKRVPTGAP